MFVIYCTCLRVPNLCDCLRLANIIMRILMGMRLSLCLVLNFLQSSKHRTWVWNTMAVLSSRGLTAFINFPKSAIINSTVLTKHVKSNGKVYRSFLRHVARVPHIRWSLCLQFQFTHVDCVARKEYVLPNTDVLGNFFLPQCFRNCTTGYPNLVLF
jgi:hypothetical protein